MLFKRGALGKKGDSTEFAYFYLIDFVLILFIIAGFFVFSADTLKDNTFEKLYLSRETALITSTMYMMNGNGITSYSGNMDKYKTEIDGGIVNIFAKRATTPVTYRFPQALLLVNPEKTELSNSRIKVVKEVDSVEINEDAVVNLNRLPCYSSAGIGSAPNIVIDPAHSTIDYGGTNANDRSFFEGKWTFILAQGIEANLKKASTELTRKYLQDSPTSQERAQKVNENTDAFIILSIGDNTNLRKNEVKAYYKKGSVESKTLACNILNSITDIFPEISGVGLIPSTQAELFLPENGLGIHLELGNIQIPEKGNTITEKEMKIAIAKGIEEYYK